MADPAGNGPVTETPNSCFGAWPGASNEGPCGRGGTRLPGGFGRAPGASYGGGGPDGRNGRSGLSKKFVFDRGDRTGWADAAAIV